MDEALGQGHLVLGTMQASVMNDGVSVLRNIVGIDTLDRYALLYSLYL